MARGLSENEELNSLSFAIDLKDTQSQIQIGMAISIPSDVKRFRASIVSLFFLCVIASVIGVALGFCLILIHDGHVNLYKFWRTTYTILPHFLICYFVGTLLLFLLILPVGFSSDGIYAHSFWGLRRFIRWQDIVKIRKFRLFNLRWLRIYSGTDGKVTWLPLFLSSPIKFGDEIRKFAPSNSPLLNHLN